MLTFGLAFLAGVMTILSPCVLPLAPIVFAGARSEGLGAPIALAAGLALTFGIVGGLLAGAGIELGGSDLVRAGSAGLMLVIGVATLVPLRRLRRSARLSRWRGSPTGCAALTQV